MPRQRDPTEVAAARERRRELQRGYEKASYHRKKQTVAELKAEVDSLQREFRVLSASRLVKNEDTGSLSDSHTDTEGDDRVSVAVRQLQQITVAIEALRYENAHLKAENQEHMQLKERIEKLVKSHRLLSSADQPFTFLSLPYEEYAATIAQAQAHALRFFNDETKATTGGSAFGWRDYRKPLGNGLFDFAMEKEFKSLSAVEMERRTWEMLSSGESYAELYDRAINPQIHLLEQINADTYLYHSVLEPMPGVIAKAVYVASRITIDDGYLIVLRAVDPDRICFSDVEGEADDGAPGAGRRHIEWQSMHAWAIIKEKGAGRTLFHFGGTNHIVYVLEVLFIVIRWETKVIGPLLMLPSIDGTVVDER